MKRVLLIDGSNLLFRMFYGIPNSIKNSKGKEIKGLIGFIGSIKRMTNELNPYSIVVLFDSETSRQTNELIDSNYKNNRKDYTNIIEEENPFSQLPLIIKALDYLDIVNFEVEENETDDYIASIVSSKRFCDYEFIICSSDTDFIQLIDNKAKLFISRGKNSILYDSEKIFDKYQIYPEQYVEYKSLVGDSSDNIKGINKIGKVTASKILNEANTINEFLLKSNNEKLKKILEINMDQLNKNIKLISLNKELCLYDLDIEKLDEYLLQKSVKEIIIEIGEN